MIIDHVGYAVKDIDKSRIQFELLGFEFQDLISDFDRNVYILFGELNGYRIELVAPITSGSVIDDYLHKVGPAPYHFCYRSGNIEEDIDRLSENGFKVVIPALPAVAFNNRRVVFMYSIACGLIEMVEE